MPNGTRLAAIFCAVRSQFESDPEQILKPMKKKRIIILGRGFAGVKCAQTLSRGLSRNGPEIVLFNAVNHFVFTLQLQ